MLYEIPHFEGLSWTDINLLEFLKIAKYFQLDEVCFSLFQIVVWNGQKQKNIY